MGIPHDWHLPRSTLGIRRPRMGRLLGLGSSRKCVSHAVAHWDSIPAFGDDAGEAWHVEDMEHVARVCHVLASYPGHVSYSKRRHQFSTCVCAIFDWQLVSMVSRTERSPVRLLFRQEQVAFAKRTQA